MESLSAQSCDCNWSPGFSQWDSNGMTYKLVEMQKLAIYWVEMKQSETFSNLPFSELAVSDNCFTVLFFKWTRFIHNKDIFNSIKYSKKAVV